MDEAVLQRRHVRVQDVVEHLTQADHDIPFDLRHLRYVRYLNNGEGRAALAATLTARLETIIGH